MSGQPDDDNGQDGQVSPWRVRTYTVSAASIAHYFIWPEAVDKVTLSFFLLVSYKRNCDRVVAVPPRRRFNCGSLIECNSSAGFCRP